MKVVCNIGGKRMYLWRAVDDEGEVLDVVLQKRRGHDAALTLLKRLLRNQPVEPETIVTDGLASYGFALRELGLEKIHRPAYGASLTPTDVIRWLLRAAGLPVPYVPFHRHHP